MSLFFAGFSLRKAGGKKQEKPPHSHIKKKKAIAKQALMLFIEEVAAHSQHSCGQLCPCEYYWHWQGIKSSKN
jgi:hypothetical protein